MTENPATKEQVKFAVGQTVKCVHTGTDLMRHGSEHSVLTVHGDGQLSLSGTGADWPYPADWFELVQAEPWRPAVGERCRHKSIPGHLVTVKGYRVMAQGAPECVWIRVDGSGCDQSALLSNLEPSPSAPVEPAQPECAACGKPSCGEFAIGLTEVLPLCEAHTRCPALATAEAIGARRCAGKTPEAAPPVGLKEDPRVWDCDKYYGICSAQFQASSTLDQRIAAAREQLVRPLPAPHPAEGRSERALPGQRWR